MPRLLGRISMMKLAGCILLLALATPSYAAVLRKAKAVEAGVSMEARLNTLLKSRHARSLPYAGGPAENANAFDPMGPVDAFLDVAANEDDSSEDIDGLIAQLEDQIAELTSMPAQDAVTLEERIAELQEQIAAKAPPPVPAPEAGPEAPQEQQQQEQAPQVSAAEVAAEAAEQAPPPPEPAGPDNSNKEDGDGNGNNGPETNGGGGGDGGGGGQQEANQQHDSGAGAPDPPAPPATPEPAPYEPPQGNGVDNGNEDTKS